MATYAVTGSSGQLGQLAVQELLARDVPATDIVAVATAGVSRILYTSMQTDSPDLTPLLGRPATPSSASSAPAQRAMANVSAHPDSSHQHPTATAKEPDDIT